MKRVVQYNTHEAVPLKENDEDEKKKKKKKKIMMMMMRVMWIVIFTYYDSKFLGREIVLFR